MTYFAKRAIPALMLALLATACSTAGEFPSLARRPGEAVSGRCGGSVALPVAAVPATPAPPPLSAEVVARLGELRQAARAGHARFGERRGRARALVSAARGASRGSEAWAVAAIALADLQSARSDVMVPLGELDRLYAEARVNGGSGEAIAAVRDEVTAWVAEEDAVLAELGRALRG